MKVRLLMLVLLGCVFVPQAQAHKTCQTNGCLRHALAWQKHDRQHLALQVSRLKIDTPSLTVAYACRVGQVVTGVPTKDCAKVVWCESRNTRTERNSATATGFAQFEDSTWAGTPFAKAGFSVYDTIPNILQMDMIAARSGFDTGYGWAASYGCHHLSGPESPN